MRGPEHLLLFGQNVAEISGYSFVTEGGFIGPLGGVFPGLAIFEHGVAVMTGENSLDTRPGPVDLAAGRRAFCDFAADDLYLGGQGDPYLMAFGDHGSI